MSKQNIKITFQCRISFSAYEALSNILEPTNHILRVGKGTARRFTFRGVPAKLVDVVVMDDVEVPRDERDQLVLELSRKFGRYDLAERDRVLIRRMYAAQAEALPHESILLGMEDTLLTLHVGPM